MIQNLITSSLNMVDTVMIGAVGENEVAAVGIANQVFFLLTLVLNGFTAGCSVFISQFWGKRDVVRIKRIVGIGLWSCLIASVLFTIAALPLARPIVSLFSRDAQVITLACDYLGIVAWSYVLTAVSFVGAATLRCMENSRAPMFVSMVALLVNAGLNYVLIFGKLGFPVMGVRGAALATLIARLIETAFILWIVLRRGSLLSGNYREYIAFDRRMVKVAFNAIIPVTLNESFWALGSIVQTAAFGLIGTAAIATMQICGTVRNLFLVVCMSMANAAMVMIGNAIGADKIQKAKDYSHKFSFLSFVTGILIGALLYLLAPLILHLFNVSAEVAASSISVLRIYAFMLVVLVFNSVTLIGTLRGGGDVHYSLFAESLTMWGIAVPLAFLGATVFHMTIEQVALLITLEEVAKFVFCAVRVSGNKWIHNMVDHPEFGQVATE